MTNEAENRTLPQEALLRASDAEIEDAVTYADPMMLRGLLYQLTGDQEVASTEVTPPAGIDAPTVARESDVAFLRAKAATYLKVRRDAGAGPIDIGPSQRLPRSLALAGGVEEVPPEDLQCWLEEVGLEPHVRGLTWNRPPPSERLASFSVVVIGAGMGGLNAAVQLKQAGIDFTVLEKNSGVGGTWFENSYPGRESTLPAVPTPTSSAWASTWRTRFAIAPRTSGISTGWPTTSTCAGTSCSTPRSCRSGGTRTTPPGR